MIADERKSQILDLLRKNGSVKVTELSEIFDVSEVTIRTYLADMENKGLLSRTHGGAISTYKPYYSMNMTQRLETNQTQKAMIAKCVSAMINSGDTVMLNSGTTTLLTFRCFPVDYHLNIVTNSISIALEAADNPNYNVVLLGGAINTKYQFSYGVDAIKQLQHYHADKLILSVDGIDPLNGLSTYYDKESDLDEVMIERSSNCIVVADNSKFYHTAFAKISDINAADCVVTNTPTTPDFLFGFNELGINIHLA